MKNSYINEVLADVLKKIAPSDEILEVVRSRRDEIMAVAGRYVGALRTYMAGAIAHKTANGDTDADCGVVLDRRTYPKLGPDGEGNPPNEIVEDVRSFIRDGLKEKHPNISFRLTKRAIKITYNEPLANGVDPSVDLIVALTRADGALWIPNLDKAHWDASDPEKHTELLTCEPAELRRLRAKVIRLAKAWNKQYAQPGLCSFNIAALALESVKDGASVAEGLSAFFEYAADDLAKRNTPDPAGVSKPIKTPIDRDQVAGRVKRTSEVFKPAIESEDENEIQDCLADVFWTYVNPPPKSSSKAAFAQALRKGNSDIRIVPGGFTVNNPNGAQLKTTRSWGG